MIDLEVGIIYQSDMDKDIFVIKELFKENKELKARVKVYSDPRKFWHRNDYKEIEPGVFEVLYKDALNFDDDKFTIVYDKFVAVYGITPHRKLEEWDKFRNYWHKILDSPLWRVING
jgi:hypothetical protein